MQFAPSLYHPLAEIGWERFGVASSFHPFLVLAAQVSVYFSLVCEIVRDSAVHLFQPEESEVVADRLGRFAAAKGVDNRVERDSSAGNIIIAVPLLDVFLHHVLHFTAFAIRDLETPAVSFRPQGGHGIDSRRSARRKIPRKSRHQQQNGDRARECKRVTIGHSKEQPAQRSREG